jgi:HAD superfamily hydrolase (TIGR01509 family)
MLKALLFDLDGTLVETDSLHFAIWRDRLQPYGYDVDRAFYQTQISGGLNPEIIARLLPQLTAEDQANFAWEKEAEFRQRATALTLLPGVLDRLDWAVKHQLKLAVVTNAPRENAAFMLQTLQVDQTFPTVILSEDLPVGKPDPLPYLEALRRLDITPDETLVFEDSPSGIQSAVRAGLYTVGIASTHDPEHLYALGAKLVIADFTDERLTDLLNQRLVPAVGVS